MKTSIYADLPAIICIERVEDNGPVEDSSATCPHCGAQGRYIFWFKCDDGTQRGAMKGCLSKFKMHRFAKIASDILYKQRENERKGWKMASWDVSVMDAIEAFARGEISESDVECEMNKAGRAKAAYMARKGYRR